MAMCVGSINRTNLNVMNNFQSDLLGLYVSSIILRKISTYSCHLILIHCLDLMSINLLQGVLSINKTEIL